MTRVKRLILLAVIVIFVCIPAHAQNDKNFAIRFGLIYLNPTSNTDTQTPFGRTGFDDGFGGEFNFEWYFTEKLGLEGDVVVALDVDVDDDDDTRTADGVTIVPTTLGLNWHPIRNDQVDWSVGVVAGVMSYTDFEYWDDDDSDSWSSDTNTEVAFGLQTSVDIPINEAWGFNAGLKYLDAEAETRAHDFTDVKFDVNPVIFRVMGVFRW